MASNRDIDSVKPKLSILLFDTVNGYTTIVKLYKIDIIILGITIVNISAEFVKPKLAWRREGQQGMPMVTGLFWLFWLFKKSIITTGYMVIHLWIYSVKPL